jgi:hypothetical protein
MNFFFHLFVLYLRWNFLFGLQNQVAMGTAIDPVPVTGLATNVAPIPLT